MRLSPKGWNNVLIFGVLLLIILFNFTRKSHLPDPSTHSVIPSDLTIVEIETPDYIISRVGRHWKSNANLSVSSEKLADIVNNWKTIHLDSATGPYSTHSAFTIKIFVAEHANPIQVQLYQQSDEQYILQVDGSSLLALPSNKLSLYLGQ